MFFCLFSFQYKFYMSFENINSFTRCAHKGKVMFGCMNCDFLYIQIWKGCRQLRIYVSRLLQLPLLCTWGNKCCSTAKLWKGAIFFPYWLHNSCCKHIKRRTDRDRDAKRERKKNCERMAVKRIISYKPDSLFYHLKRLKKCVLQFNTQTRMCVCAWTHICKNTAQCINYDLQQSWWDVRVSVLRQRCVDAAWRCDWRQWNR